MADKRIAGGLLVLVGVIGAALWWSRVELAPPPVTDARPAPKPGAESRPAPPPAPDAPDVKRRIADGLAAGATQGRAVAEPGGEGGAEGVHPSEDEVLAVLDEIAASTGLIVSLDCREYPCVGTMAWPPGTPVVPREQLLEHFPNLWDWPSTTQTGAPLMAYAFPGEKLAGEDHDAVQERLTDMQTLSLAKPPSF
ncbi:MAG: hypothetical protein EP330_30780 [Deltaproteobacteria bacterium]|nr:MAG: hypothetical protein EP330_30780 [Deltaproteobacteria bacterium]